jgi:hypothetical protein
MGGIVALVILAIFKSSIHDNGNYGHLDAVWRLVTGLILVPCFGTLVQRILLPGQYPCLHRPNCFRMTDVITQNRQSSRMSKPCATTLL